MPRQTVPQNNFNCGEISPRAFGRYDYEKYPNALKKLENFLINQLGGAQFSPGSRYVATTKNSANRSHLIPFQYNSQQAYLLELGDMYMRFYTQQAQVVVNASVPIDSYTKFLSHFNGANGQASYTAETGQVLSFFGDAQLDTSQKEFGASSVKFDGSGDYVNFPASSDWTFTTSDFTIDFWFKMSATSNDGTIFGLGSTRNVQVDWNHTSGKFELYLNNSLVINQSWAAPDTGWHHFAIARSGTALAYYIDGVSFGTAVNSTNVDASGTVGLIGYGTVSPHYYSGWIDEFRISKGIARWTTGFTPPTVEYGGAADWVTSHNYVVGDYVTHSATVYICLVAHTSGTFATDLAAGKWAAQVEYEIATPYAIADVPDIHYSQNADVMYLYHKSYKTQKVTRVSASQFTIVDAPFVRGPFLDTNITAVTLTASSATGAGTTITASSATFLAGHVGSLWRIKNAVVKITAFASVTSVTADVQAEPDGTAGNIGSTAAQTDWAEGQFSVVRGYAATGTFHQQRHYLAATTSKPQNAFGSYIGAYDNFKADANDTSAAINFQIVSEQINQIKWLNSDTDFMDAGTSGGVFPISSGTQGLTITSANVKANKDTSYGAYQTQPKRISSYLYYIHKSLMRIFELTYNVIAGRQLSNDMTLLADHILRDGDGAFDMDYQQTPNDRIWVIRNDGQMAVMTRNVEQQIVGWARRIAGTDSTTSGSYESVAIIQQETQDDEVWVIVKRKINGSTKRFVEFFTPENFTYVWEPVLLDASLTFDSPINISGATKASPVVITALSHGFSNGDYVKIDKVLGMTQLNGNTYKIKNKTTDTFELTDTSDVNVDGTAYTTYISGGEVRKKVTAISGLSHLEGETVSVQADGAVPSTATYLVSGGAITLSDRAAVVHVGLPYTGKIQLLKQNTQSKTGTGQMKKKRPYRIDFRVNQSKAFKFGQDENSLKTISMPSSAGTDIYSGDVENNAVGGWWDEGPEPMIVQDKPLPLMVLAALIRYETEEQE